MDRGLRYAATAEQVGRVRNRGRRARRFWRFSKRSASRRCGAVIILRRSAASRPPSIMMAAPFRLSQSWRRARGLGQRKGSGPYLGNVGPDRARIALYLAFDRLEAQAMRSGNPTVHRVAGRLMATPAGRARAPRASRHPSSATGNRRKRSIAVVALMQNLHALSIHQAIWRALAQLQTPDVIGRSLRRADHHAVFYLDPHARMRCRARSTELLPSARIATTEHVRRGTHAPAQDPRRWTRRKPRREVLEAKRFGAQRTDDALDLRVRVVETSARVDHEVGARHFRRRHLCPRRSFASATDSPRA